MVWSYGWAVPVEFLSDQEAAAFGRYGGSVPLADLERFFYLDDADRKLVAGQREDHNRLGFSAVRFRCGRRVDHSSKRVPTVFGMNASPNRAPMACCARHPVQ
jgi:hypothetical protein